MAKKHKSCIAGIEEALMMGYDVDCQISKGKKHSTIEFSQTGETHGKYRSALRFGVANEKMDNEINRAWNESGMALGYPITSVEKAENVLDFLKDLGYKVGRVK